MKKAQEAGGGDSIEEMGSLGFASGDCGNFIFRLHPFLGKRNPRPLSQMFHGVYHR